jgi:hypothetical protein
VERHLSGRAPIPSDTPFASDALNGTVFLGGCAGSIIRTRQSRPSAPAMVLTAGHCLEPMPAHGAAVIGRRDRQYVYLENRHGDTVVRAATTRVLYGTMTGTDAAVLRLDETYADLARAHVHAFELATHGPTPGQALRVLSGSSGVAWSCRVQAIVPELLEGGYRTVDAIRYRPQEGCDSQLGEGPSHGDSGAPLIDPSSGLIVGLHGTSNDEGGHCGPNNPCEIDGRGVTTSVEGRKYGEQTAGMAPCLTGGSRLLLSRPGCAVTPQGNGKVTVEIRDLSDPQGLEKALNEVGVPANVVGVPASVVPGGGDGQACVPSNLEPADAEAGAAPEPVLDTVEVGGDSAARFTVSRQQVHGKTLVLATTSGTDGKSAVEATVAADGASSQLETLVPCEGSQAPAHTTPVEPLQSADEQGAQATP